MRRAFTLLECLAVLALMGLLAAIAVPRAAGLLDRARTTAAAERLARALAVARQLASAQGSVTVLAIGDSTLTVTRAADGALLWREAGAAALAVQVRGTPREHRFAPGGLGLGLANATYELVRGRSVVRVVVSRYGRVRVER